jgi:hypothetical protein
LAEEIVIPQILFPESYDADLDRSDIDLGSHIDSEDENLNESLDGSTEEIMEDESLITSEPESEMDETLVNHVTMLLEEMGFIKFLLSIIGGQKSLIEANVEKNRCGSFLVWCQNVFPNISPSLSLITICDGVAEFIAYFLKQKSILVDYMTYLQVEVQFKPATIMSHLTAMQNMANWMGIYYTKFLDGIDPELRGFSDVIKSCKKSVRKVQKRERSDDSMKTKVKSFQLPSDGLRGLQIAANKQISLQMGVLPENYIDISRKSYQQFMNLLFACK